MGKDFKYNIRLNPNNPDHQEVAKILDSLTKRGEKSQLIVDAILICTGKKSAINPQPVLLKETINAMVEEILREKGIQAEQKRIAPRAEPRPVPESEKQNGHGTESLNKELILQSMKDFGL